MKLVLSSVLCLAALNAAWGQQRKLDRTPLGYNRNDRLPQTAHEDEAFFEAFAAESMSLTNPPTPSPTPPPTTPPTPPPSPPPTKNPTGPPTPPPTPAPTTPPTPPPTGLCDIELDLRCVFGDDETACDQIRGEENIECACPECVREITFMYTGNACAAGAQNCADEENGPDSVARLVISNAANENEVFFSGPVSAGSGDDLGTLVVVTAGAGACLPDSLAAFVFPAVVEPGANPTASQMITVDSQCEGQANGLNLLDSNGALDFVGYSCGEGDDHNCFVDVFYEVEACNTGQIDLTISEFTFTLNGEEPPTDLLAGIPDELLLLIPDACFETVQQRIVERCGTFEYCAEAEVIAVSEDSGPVCQDMKELKFSVDVGTIPPSSSPTAPPTNPPTPPPTPAPTTPPTPPPTPSPTKPPTEVPSASPTPPPTGVCSIDLEMTCATAANPDIPCTSLEAEEDIVCTCPNCVTEMIFTYTGAACNGREGCTDTSAPQSSAMFVVINPDTGAQLFMGMVDNVGDEIKLASTTCLPDNLEVLFTPLGGGTAFQTVIMDSSCDDRGLFLQQSYGALDFVGYTCDDNSVHNCIEEVIYGFEVCNTGEVEMTVFELGFTLNKAVPIDLLTDIADRTLEPNECFTTTADSEVDLCEEMEYCAESFVNASSPDNGPTCFDRDEIKFSIESVSVPPTPSPTSPPTPSPTPPPTPSPTPPPTPSPTSPPTPSPTPPPTPSPTKPPTEAPSVPPTLPPTNPPTANAPVPCPLDLNIDVETLCNLQPFDICTTRPYRMEFLYRGGNCGNTSFATCSGDAAGECNCQIPQEDNWAENKFFCEDIGTVPAPFDRNQTVWISAGSDKGDLYFDGPVRVGDSFNATDPAMVKVQANMLIQVFATDGTAPGALLQEVLFHSSCSQELYLADIFGGIQLIEFEFIGKGCSNPEIINLFRRTDFEFDIDLAVEANSGGPLQLDFAQLFLINGLDPNLIQVANFDVKGQTIPPALSLSSDFGIARDTPYTARAVVTGAINGRQCTGDAEVEFICERICGPRPAECPEGRRELGNVRGGAELPFLN